MENLLKQFANGGGEVTSKGLSADFRVNLSGSTTVTKGNLSYTLCFYAYLDEMPIKNAITVGDFESSDSYDYNFNGIPVDNMVALKNTLNSSGLKTVSDSLNVEWKDERAAVAKEIQNNKLFKKIYGKNAFVWETLSDDEQKILRLEHAIENYENLTATHWGIKDFVTEENKIDDDGNIVYGSNEKPLKVRIKPTLEQLNEFLNEAKNK